MAFAPRLVRTSDMQTIQMAMQTDTRMVEDLRRIQYCDYQHFDDF